MSPERQRTRTAAKKAGKKTTRWGGQPLQHGRHSKGPRLIEDADERLRLRASTVRLAKALVDDAKARNVAPPADIAEIASNPSKRAWTKQG